MSIVLVLLVVWAVITVVGHATWVAVSRIVSLVTGGMTRAGNAGTSPSPDPFGSAPDPVEDVRAFGRVLSWMVATGRIPASQSGWLRAQVTELVASPSVEKKPAPPAPLAEVPGRESEMVVQELDDQTRAPESQFWTATANSFLAQHNIRWGELVAGLLIVACSIGLVVSLWSTLTEAHRVVPTLIFVSADAAIFAAGLYTMRRWRLRHTSRAVLIVATLLVPLCVLAGLAAARANVDRVSLTDPITILAIVGSTLGCGWLLRLASRCLVGRVDAAAFMTSVIGPTLSLALLPAAIRRVAAMGDVSLAAWLVMGPAVLVAGSLLWSTRVRPSRIIGVRAMKNRWLAVGVGIASLAAVVGYAVVLLGSPSLELDRRDVWIQLAIATVPAWLAVAAVAMRLDAMESSIGQMRFAATVNRVLACVAIGAVVAMLPAAVGASSWVWALGGMASASLLMVSLFINRWRIENLALTIVPVGVAACLTSTQWLGDAVWGTLPVWRLLVSGEASVVAAGMGLGFWVVSMVLRQNPTPPAPLPEARQEGPEARERDVSGSRLAACFFGLMAAIFAVGLTFAPESWLGVVPAWGISAILVAASATMATEAILSQHRVGLSLAMTVGAVAVFGLQSNQWGRDVWSIASIVDRSAWWRMAIVLSTAAGVWLSVRAWLVRSQRANWLADEPLALSRMPDGWMVIVSGMLVAAASAVEHLAMVARPIAEAMPGWVSEPLGFDWLSGAAIGLTLLTTVAAWWREPYGRLSLMRNVVIVAAVVSGAAAVAGWAGTSAAGELLVSTWLLLVAGGVVIGLVRSDRVGLAALLGMLTAIASVSLLLSGWAWPFFGSRGGFDGTGVLSVASWMTVGSVAWWVWAGRAFLVNPSPPSLVPEAGRAQPESSWELRWAGAFLASTLLVFAGVVVATMVWPTMPLLSCAAVSGWLLGWCLAWRGAWRWVERDRRGDSLARRWAVPLADVDAATWLLPTSWLMWLVWANRPELSRNGTDELGWMVAVIVAGWLAAVTSVARPIGHGVWSTAMVSWLSSCVLASLTVTTVIRSSEALTAVAACVTACGALAVWTLMAGWLAKASAVLTDDPTTPVQTSVILKIDSAIPAASVLLVGLSSLVAFALHIEGKEFLVRLACLGIGVLSLVQFWVAERTDWARLRTLTVATALAGLASLAMLGQAADAHSPLVATMRLMIVSVLASATLLIMIPRWLPGAFLERWRRAIRRGGMASLIVSLGTSFLMLTMEAMWRSDVGLPAVALPLVIVVALVLAVLAVIAATLAVLSGPIGKTYGLGWSDDWRRGVVWLAQGIAVTTWLHLFLCRPELGLFGLREVWPYVVMGLAFVGVGLTHWARRIGDPVIATSMQRTSLFLPVIPIVGFWLGQSSGVEAGGWAFEGGVSYRSVLVVAAIGYGGMSLVWKRALPQVMTVVLANAALWVTLTQSPGWEFLSHPQAWLIPPSVCVLLAAQWNRRRLGDSLTTAIRYGATLAIYLSSTADLVVNEIGSTLAGPMILISLALAGMLAGVVMRIKPFLVLGAVFVLLGVTSMVAYAGQAIDAVWPWWVFGISLGLLLLVGLAMLERFRPELTRWGQRIASWEG